MEETTLKLKSAEIVLEKKITRTVENVLREYLSDRLAKDIAKDIIKELADEDDFPDDGNIITNNDEVAPTAANAVIKMVWKDARYAAASYSENLMYQTYGKLQMARTLKIVSYDDSQELHRFIIKEHINNGPWRNECEKLGRL